MVTAASDLAGLICAFDLASGQVRGRDVLDEAPASPVWLHFNLSDTRACLWLQHQANLPDAVQELILGPETRIRHLVLPDAFAAVIGDLHHDYRGDPEDLGVLRIYVDAQRIITARAHPLRSSDMLRHEILRGEQEVPTPFAVFEQLLACLAETFGHTVAGLADQADDAEEEILAGHLDRRARSLGGMRRLLARLRRHLSGNRATILQLTSRLPAVFGSELRQNLRHAVERLDGVAQDLELVQERARLLQEELAGRVGESTNRNLFVLSIVTTTLLPITLITGVFGMNVGGLPWLGDSSGFWWVMLLMAAAVVVVLVALRRRRVL